jgi:hypothetical protein
MIHPRVLNETAEDTHNIGNIGTGGDSEIEEFTY